ncbi:hypothetical protein AYO41_00065 [Verrucomicrobia bacterium SCGC AG-212-E04]|nr:hypothetical protein AYO41_00065 [Verrucomicrobia bacterium SCGC AG-212-E04]
MLVTCAVASAPASEWQTNYEKALATAKTENKLVLLDFTGSDWCGPCIALKKNVFSQAKFLEYAKKHFVLVEIDYPQKSVLADDLKQQNEKLKKQYGIDRKGYPTVIVVNSEGKIIGEFNGYDGEGPADIIARLEKWRS